MLFSTFILSLHIQWVFLCVRKNLMLLWDFGYMHKNTNLNIYFKVYVCLGKKGLAFISRVAGKTSHNECVKLRISFRFEWKAAVLVVYDSLSLSFSFSFSLPSPLPTFLVGSIAHPRHCPFLAYILRYNSTFDSDVYTKKNASLLCMSGFLRNFVHNTHTYFTLCSKFGKLFVGHQVQVIYIYIVSIRVFLVSAEANNESEGRKSRKRGEKSKGEK